MILIFHNVFCTMTGFWIIVNGIFLIFKKKIFNVYLFLRERESDRAREGKGQRERETQNLKQAPGSELSAESPMWGSNSGTERS